MPKSGLNVALKGLDDLSAQKKPGRKNSGNRYSRFLLMRCTVKTTRSKFWTMML